MSLCSTFTRNSKYSAILKNYLKWTLKAHKHKSTIYIKTVLSDEVVEADRLLTF